MLLKEHDVFHKMGAKEAGLSEKAVMHVARTTSQTGEQFHCEVPIYPGDSREQIRTRLNFFLSIIQDRMEDENEAVMRNNQAHQKKVAAQEALRRNNESFAKQAKALKKRLSKGQIEQDAHDLELADLKGKLAQANEDLEKSLELSADAAKAALETAEKEVELREDPEGE